MLGLSSAFRSNIQQHNHRSSGLTETAAIFGPALGLGIGHQIVTRFCYSLVVVVLFLVLCSRRACAPTPTSKSTTCHARCHSLLEKEVGRTRAACLYLGNVTPQLCAINNTMLLPKRREETD